MPRRRNNNKKKRMKKKRKQTKSKSKINNNSIISMKPSTPTTSWNRHNYLKQSFESEQDYLTFIMWSIFPYRYRKEGHCKSFYFDEDLASIFWDGPIWRHHDSPMIKDYPKCYQIFKKYQENKYQDPFQNLLFSTFSNWTIFDLKYWIKQYIESQCSEWNVMQKYQRYDDFVKFRSFLESVQFGDVVHINHIPGMMGTYIIGFGDADWGIILKYYICEERKTKDFSQFLRLIPITNLYKEGHGIIDLQFGSLQHRYNCIPMEFCDAPIHYFSHIPVNLLGFNEIRFLDPNRINLIDFEYNLMINRLNQQTLDILNKESVQIKVLRDKNESDIVEGNSDLINDCYVICTDLETMDGFCWMQKNHNVDELDFDGLGVKSWIKRYDEFVRGKRDAFYEFFGRFAKHLGEEAVDEIVSCLL